MAIPHEHFKPMAQSYPGPDAFCQLPGLDVVHIARLTVLKVDALAVQPQPTVIHGAFHLLIHIIELQGFCHADLALLVPAKTPGWACSCKACWGSPWAGASQLLAPKHWEPRGWGAQWAGRGWSGSLGRLFLHVQPHILPPIVQISGDNVSVWYTYMLQYDYHYSISKHLYHVT